MSDIEMRNIDPGSSLRPGFTLVEVEYLDPEYSTLVFGLFSRFWSEFDAVHIG